MRRHATGVRVVVHHHVVAWHNLFHLTPADQRARFPVLAAHAAHGFRVVAHAARDPACGGATVWLARRAA